MPVLSIEAFDFIAEEDFSASHQAATQVAPWKLNPQRLTSWWEVLTFSAQSFFWCGRSLRSLKTDCLMGSIPGSGDENIFQVSRDLDEMAKDRSRGSLAFIQHEFHKIGLDIAAETAKEVVEELESDARHNFQWLMDQITTIEKIAEKELRGKVFLYVPPEQAKFFPTQANPFPYPQKALQAFPSSLYDANEAVWCLGTSRSTAAVFHLMRILEIGLAALGNVFGVSLLHTNWGPALDQIESKIREMHKDPVWKALPDCKEQQEFYAQAASHLGILKDAWRNYTMHVRAKYTLEEAEQVFGNVKAFMAKLAERVSEQPLSQSAHS